MASVLTIWCTTRQCEVTTGIWIDGRGAGTPRPSDGKHQMHRLRPGEFNQDCVSETSDGPLRSGRVNALPPPSTPGATAGAHQGTEAATALRSVAQAKTRHRTATRKFVFTYVCHLDGSGVWYRRPVTGLGVHVSQSLRGTTSAPLSPESGPLKALVDLRYTVRHDGLFRSAYPYSRRRCSTRASGIGNVAANICTL
jgi:hypothetical protein